jgi:hypothetical protein
MPSQTTFVQGRNIFDNVMMANKAIFYAKENNQDLALLLLDFEKTFAWVSWSFLQASMLQLRFNTTWISWVMVLYGGVLAIMEINKSLCPKFDLHQSIKQGCPLAPCLFLLFMDVFGHMFINQRNGVQGLKFPDGNKQCHGCLQMTLLCSWLAIKTIWTK